MFKIKIILSLLLLSLIIYPFAIFAQNSLNQEKNQTAIKQNIQKPVKQ